MTRCPRTERPRPIGELEQLILAALTARSGGDLLYRRNRENGKLFRLAPSIHDMRAVARERAEEDGHTDAKWKRRFNRAWRALCDCGALEVPCLIPIAEVSPACQRHVHNLADGTYIDGGRHRLYVRLTGKPAPPPSPRVVCCECGIDLPNAHRLRKRCRACSANLVKRHNAKTAAERPKRRRTQLATAGCECCRRTFFVAKSDQLFCSPVCTQKTYRERKAMVARDLQPSR
jgi:hypothetical protein